VCRRCPAAPLQRPGRDSPVPEWCGRVLAASRRRPSPTAFPVEPLTMLTTNRHSGQPSTDQQRVLQIRQDHLGRQQRGLWRKNDRFTSFARSGEPAGSALAGVTSSMTTRPPTRTRSTSRASASSSRQPPSAKSRSNVSRSCSTSAASPAITCTRGFASEQLACCGCSLFVDLHRCQHAVVGHRVCHPGRADADAGADLGDPATTTTRRKDGQEAPTSAGTPTAGWDPLRRESTGNPMCRASAYARATSGG